MPAFRQSICHVGGRPREHPAVDYTRTPCKPEQCSLGELLWAVPGGVGESFLAFSKYRPKYLVSVTCVDLPRSLDKVSGAHEEKPSHALSRRHWKVNIGPDWACTLVYNVHIYSSAARTAIYGELVLQQCFTQL